VTDLPGRLESLVRSTPWLLEALRAARDVDPPDWLVGGGVLRDLVWDRLHGQSRPAPPRDVDLAFFDPTRLDRARDAEVEQALAARLPGVPWDAKNQAAVHTWYGRVFGGRVAPLRSAADGVATWPETATAVAVRLLPHDRLEVVAPCGLDDLFGLVCRRNPRRVTVDHYHRRLHDKRIAERWPRVEIVLEGQDGAMRRWAMSGQEPHAGGEQEQRPVGGVEGEEEQEVAQGDQAREREREVKAAEAERSDGGEGTGG
jgi:uncharacterized protein